MFDIGRESAPPRWIIGLVLVGFFVAGVGLDQVEYFSDARGTLQGNAGPSGMPDDGAIGRAVDVAVARFGARGVFGNSPEALPSTLIMTADQLAGDLPVLSIAVDNDHLNDPATGILANMRATGPEWERLASVSLWDNGELQVGSRAGLRIHGDSSRHRGEPSFRLHFRPAYGATSVDGARLLGGSIARASAVVVHVVRYRGHYPNIFVFEIAQRLGLPTVAFRPVRVFLNGEERGIYVLTERVMPDGWGRSHFGDVDFFMYVYKGETKAPSRRAHAELQEWFRAADPFTMALANERLDVENLTRHLFTLMFCFTTDWAQGAALLDRDRSDALWFWTHWDMDQSFHARGPSELASWEQPVMELITLRAPRDALESYSIVTDDRHFRRHRGDLRRLLFIELLRDPEYRGYFVRLVTDILNHELTEAFFDDMLARYEHLARRPGVFSRVDLGAYLEHRPDFVRAAVAEFFNLGDAVPITIDGGPSARLLIDGYHESDRYDGRYFPGQTLRAEAAEGTTPVSHWLIDGERRDGPRLRITVREAHEITAVFEGS